MQYFGLLYLYIGNYILFGLSYNPMREKLKELSEILKQNTAIKERLERLEFGCKFKIQQKLGSWEVVSWISNYVCMYTNYIEQPFLDYLEEYHFFCPFFWRLETEWKSILQSKLWEDEFAIIVTELIGHEPQYSDILEYLGYWYSMDYTNIFDDTNFISKVYLSPWPLSEQSDSTLDEIISLCKNVCQLPKNS